MNLDQVEPDYYSLCGTCGAISLADKWEAFQRDRETGELRPSRSDEMDPIVRCPICGGDHWDCDDSYPVWMGTFAEMQLEREDNLGDFGDVWADPEPRRA